MSANFLPHIKHTSDCPKFQQIFLKLKILGLVRFSVGYNLGIWFFRENRYFCAGDFICGGNRLRFVPHIKLGYVYFRFTAIFDPLNILGGVRFTVGYNLADTNLDDFAGNLYRRKCNAEQSTLSKPLISVLISTQRWAFIIRDKITSHPSVFL